MKEKKHVSIEIKLVKMKSKLMKHSEALQLENLTIPTLDYSSKDEVTMI